MGRAGLEVGDLSAPRIGVVFPGQGSQTVGMGAGIAAASPAAAECFREASEILGYDLLALCTNGPEERLRETRFSQPAIFVVNVALARAAGDALAPAVSAGHSFAELCSLTLARAMTFETALRLVNERGAAMHRAASASHGAMAAILGLEAETLRAAVAAAVGRGAGRVQLANFNQPGQIVISGDAGAVAACGELALAAGAKRVIALNVSGAWHSELMLPAREEFAPFVAAARIEPPAFPVVSSVDAEPYADVARIRTNLVRSITDEVRWHDAALRMVATGLDLIVEFGASAVLAPMFKRVPGAPKALFAGDAAGIEKVLSSLAAVAS